MYKLSIFPIICRSREGSKTLIISIVPEKIIFWQILEVSWSSSSGIEHIRYIKVENRHFMLILGQKVAMYEYIEKLTDANRLIVFRESTFQGKGI